jgi:carbon starvation protein
MNAPAALTGADPTVAAGWVNGLGLGGTPITPADISAAAANVGETSIISRTGGAPTLAIGMSQVLSGVFGGTALAAFWYHFAIMFEALFILTTVDAGTRVARFMLSDTIGNLGGAAKRFRDPSWRVGAWLCSAVVVGCWGAIMLMGVTDPLGGINTLFPLFGIANQLLAAVALTVVTAVLIKKGRGKWAWIAGAPLIWDLIITMTASYEKIFSSNPKIGYWANHQAFLAAKESGAQKFGSAATPEAIDAVIRNTFIQGTLSIVFAVLVLIVVAAAVTVCVRSVKLGGTPTSEDPGLPSHLFAPSGLIASKAEKAVQAEWDELDHRSVVSARSH